MKSIVTILKNDIYLRWYFDTFYAVRWIKPCVLLIRIKILGLSREILWVSEKKLFRYELLLFDINLLWNVFNFLPARRGSELRLLQTLLILSSFFGGESCFIHLFTHLFSFNTQIVQYILNYFLLV